MTTDKKDLNYYLRLPYSVVLIPAEEGGYAVKIAELPGCLSQGETVEEALAMIEDAKRGWLEVALNEGMDIPEPGREEEEYSGRILLRAPKSLHRELVQRARREGVSLNQFITYQLSKGLRKDV